MKHSILFIDPDSRKNTLLAGGQSRITFNIASRLSARGYKTTIVCSKYPGYENYVDSGVQYEHIGLATNIRILNFASFFMALPFFLLKRKEHLAFECFSAPMTTFLSPLFFKGPVIGITAMVEAKVFQKKYFLPFTWFEKLGMKLYDRIIAYSDYYKKKILVLNPACSVQIIAPGIDARYFTTTPSIDHANPYGLYIGRIDILQKGLDLLIEAVAKSDAATYIVIAGFGTPQDEKQLLELIANHNLQNKVRFVGRVEGAQKHKLLEGASFGIAPSRFETFCVSCLEFLALGKEVIHFDIGGLEWIPGFCGSKVKQFDIDKLSKALNKSASHYGGVDRRIQDFAQQYEWERIVDKYEHYIATL